MIFESEFLILTLAIFSVTAASWWLLHGPTFKLADLTIVEPREKSRHSRIRQKSTHSPVLLPVSAATASVASAPPAVLSVTTNPGDKPDQPLDAQAQLNRVSHILQNAINVAAKAERLHNAAHEQLDSAHYALQNLLSELSTVMPIASKVAAAQATPAKTFPAERPAYITALAA